MTGVRQLARSRGDAWVALLAGFATVDLGLQAVLADVAGTLALARAVVPPGTLATLSWLAGWAMLATFTVQVVPHLFPVRLLATTRSARFRAPVAGVAVGAGVLLEAATGGGLDAEGQPVPWTPVADALGVWTWWVVVVVGGALAVAATVRTTEGGLLGEGFAADLLDAATPFERVERAGVRRLAVALAAVQGAAVLLGAFLLVGEALSPLTEAVAAAWGVAWLLGETLGLPLAVPGRQWLDLKRRLSGLAAVPAAGSKGVASFLVVATGLLAGGVGAGVYLETLVVVGQQVLAGTYSSPRLGLFVAVGWVATTAYTLWYWLRVADRLPYFLDEWVVVSPREVVTQRQWVDRRPQVARPPGLMVPAALVWMVTWTGQYRAAERFDGSLPDHFLVGLVVALVVVGASVLLAYRLSPQSPLSDAVALPAALTVHLVLFALALSRSTSGPSEAMVGLVEYPLNGGVPAGWALEHLVLALSAVGLLVALVFYLPDVREQRHRGGPFLLLPGGFVLAAGAGMHVASEALLASATDAELLARLLSGLGLVLAVLGAVAMLAKASLLVPRTSVPGEGTGDGLYRYARGLVMGVMADGLALGGPAVVAEGSTARGALLAVASLLLLLALVDVARRVPGSVRSLVGSATEEGGGPTGGPLQGGDADGPSPGPSHARDGDDPSGGSPPAREDNGSSGGPPPDSPGRERSGESPPARGDDHTSEGS